MMRLGFVGLLLLGGLACDGTPVTGPVDPVWDRDTCDHCRMAVSDRQFATQVRSARDGTVRHFDDPGCAALAGAEPEDEIWVRDAGGGGWLDARTARFARGHSTPMGHGWGASAGEGALGWAALVADVEERERERRSHRGH